MELGEKIKALRKARGLTQAQLAGEHITRNMLCEIEKGKASPSLDTLSAIAEGLSVPAAFLLDEGEDLFGYAKRSTMTQIRKLFLSGDYGACFRLCETLPGEPDDEIAFLLAHCALGEGRRAFYRGNMETALVYFTEALGYAEKSSYPTEDICASATLYAALAGNVAAPRRDFNEELYQINANIATESELFAYVTDKVDYPFSNPLLAEHQAARALMKQKRYREALPKLLSLEEHKGEDGVSAYFLFRLYSDMEICYREEQDFERAYKYSTKRITLLSAFQS